MSEAVAHTKVLNTPLVGLENLESVQVRPLPLQMLFAAFNRLLRFEFPPQRNDSVYKYYVGKGLIQPRLSNQQMAMLPIGTIEALAALVFDTSVNALMCQRPDSDKMFSASFNEIVAFIIAWTDLNQYEHFALVSEDLALLESHPNAGLSSHYYKASTNTEQLYQTLKMEGFRTDILPFFPQVSESLTAYWLCRQLSLILPFAAVSKMLDSASAETYPQLYRLGRLVDFIAAKIPVEIGHGNTAIKDIVGQAMGLIRLGLENGFSTCAAQAGVSWPVKKVILVEGSTEERLIPAVAGALGDNLHSLGIQIMPVGGKNQMLEHYVYYAERLAVPINIVLDGDAEPLMPDLEYYRRPQDEIYIIAQGEFEDLYPASLIVETINTGYHPIAPVSAALFLSGESRVKRLQALWHELGLGVFDKVEFAQRIANCIECLPHPDMLGGDLANLVQKLLIIPALNSHA